MTDQDTYYISPSLADYADRIIAELQRHHTVVETQSAEPRRLTLMASCTTDAAGYGFMAIPGPGIGFVDDVRNVVIGGATYQATAKGNATLCVMSSPWNADSAVPLGVVRDFSSTLPATSFYQKDQVVVHQGSFLGVQIYDSTEAGESYLAVVSFVRIPAGALGSWHAV